ncbi:MAG: class I SAM-dependent methyltransferase [Gemmataceae bacterium]
MATSPTAVNYWPDDATAKAFWSQHELPPYQELLADTADWIDPGSEERWLDLGCGGGHLTRAIWRRSRGRVGQIIALDCAAKNQRAIDKLNADIGASSPEQIQFLHADFSSGLAHWEDGHFDGVVSGLAIQYAESYSEESRCWTTEAYQHLLKEVHRVLRPDGCFVFSVNVPEPAWGKVALGGLPAVFRSRKPARFLKNALRMYRYGFWLSRQARDGRFHYLPASQIAGHLRAAGFAAVEHRTSYAGQAFVFRCRKPG